MACTPTQGLLRLAACSIGFYDFVITLPSEIRFYLRMHARRRVNVPLVLFPMTRYFGLITLIWTMAGYYGTGYSPGVCSRYMWVGPIFRVLAASSASAILVWRTWAICGHSKFVLLLMALLWAVVLAVDCYSITGQIPIQGPNHDCHSTSRSNFQATWSFYLANTVFDCVACTISSVKLWKNAESGHIWLPLTRFLFRDGILYFILLTCLNGVNIGLLFQSQEELKYAGTALAVAFTMILSQRIILSLQERLIPISTESESFVAPSRTTEPSAGEMDGINGSGSGSQHRHLNSVGSIGSLREFFTSPFLATTTRQTINNSNIIVNIANTSPQLPRNTALNNSVGATSDEALSSNRFSSSSSIVQH